MGLKGLVSLDKKTKIRQYKLIRPLLDQKKEDLEFIVKNVFNFYVKIHQIMMKNIKE